MLRRTTADVLRRAPAKAWTREAVHPERGVVTLRDLVQTQLDHNEEHLRQVREIKKRL